MYECYYLTIAGFVRSKQITRDIHRIIYLNELNATSHRWGNWVIRRVK